LFNGTHESTVSLAVDDRGLAGVDVLFGQHLIASIGSMRKFSVAENLDSGGLLLNDFGDRPRSELISAAGSTTHQAPGRSKQKSPESANGTQ
jgi:hypothetical protein